jgi:DNA repair ATPase RecN
MTFINPLAPALLPSAQAQQQAAADKARQIRKAQTAARNIAAEADRLEHQVESAEELTPVHDEDNPSKREQGRQPKRDGQGKADDEPHIDVKA